MDKDYVLTANYIMQTTWKNLSEKIAHTLTNVIVVILPKLLASLISCTTLKWYGNSWLVICNNPNI